MKQEQKPQTDLTQEDMDLELSSTDNLSTDIVEDFARQLDEVVRIQSEDDEEEETDEDNFGYEMLPQDEDEEKNVYQALESEDEEEEQDVKDPFTIEVSSSDSLNPETSDLIKSIMANIQLSDEAIPDWAKKIPESAWLPRVNPKND